jgi:hypothetical protein
MKGAKNYTKFRGFGPHHMTPLEKTQILCEAFPDTLDNNKVI